LDFIAQVLVSNGKEKSQDLQDIFEIRAGLSASRFLSSRQNIPKSSAYREILHLYPDKEFKQIARMNKESFAKMVEEFQDHEVFHRAGRHKQHAVWIQLIVVLSRLGCDGNGASVGRHAGLFGISYGSVCKFTKRVFKAILSKLVINNTSTYD
jgi:hypothetical protein